MRKPSLVDALMAELDRALIAQRIQRAREEAGLSQPELGEALDPPVHWRTVQTWESAKDRRVPFKRLGEIAEITGTTKEWLLHGRELDAQPATSVSLAELHDEIAELRGMIVRLERLLVERSAPPRELEDPPDPAALRRERGALSPQLRNDRT